MKPILQIMEKLKEVKTFVYDYRWIGKQKKAVALSCSAPSPTPPAAHLSPASEAQG